MHKRILTSLLLTALSAMSFGQLSGTITVPPVGNTVTKTFTIEIYDATTPGALPLSTHFVTSTGGPVFPFSGMAFTPPSSNQICVLVYRQGSLPRAASATVVLGAATINVSLVQGDVNVDGVIDLADYVLLANAFNTWGPNIPEDLNYDGTVDVGDYGILSANYGQVGDSC